MLAVLGQDVKYPNAAEKEGVRSQVTVVVNQVWYILVGTRFLALMMEVWFDTVRFPFGDRRSHVFLALLTFF